MGSTEEAFKVLLSNRLVILFICIPIAWILQHTGAKPVHHFAANFGAIIPLSWLISECTEHLEGIVGPTIGVLLNSTFGNLVEIILSVQAIRAGLVKVVQSSLLGAVVMNLLFVTGCCFLVAGMQTHNQTFNPNAVSYSLGLLGISQLALLVPSELAATDEWSDEGMRLNLSRFVAVLLGAMYVQWLSFSMCTHKELMDAESPRSASYAVVKGVEDTGNPEHGQLRLRASAAVDIVRAGGDCESISDDDFESEEEEPRLPGPIACALLLAATVLVAFHCDFLVESIEPVTHQLHIHEAFVSTVLLPMVGNFSEEIAAISIASKGKLDLAMGVAIGSATQIAMLVVPIVVFLGWALGQPFDLDFEVLQVRLLLASLLVATLCLRDAHANWLKGSMLITAYLIIASAFWFMCDKEFRSAGEARPLAELAEEAAAKARVSQTVVPESHI